MLLSPHRHSIAAESLRVVCCWLAIVIVLQGLAAAHWRGIGPLHRHVQEAPSVAATLLGRMQPPKAHRHDHGQAERHHHAADDASVVQATPTEADVLDPVAFALTAALALLALGAGWPPSRTAAQAVWRCGAGWTAAASWAALPYRPPRLH